MRLGMSLTLDVALHGRTGMALHVLAQRAVLFHLADEWRELARIYAPKAKA